MTIAEQDTWAYCAARRTADPPAGRLEEALEMAGHGAHVSLRGLLMGWLLWGPEPARGKADPGVRRGHPGL